MTCAHAVSVGFKKITGVESVDIGLQRGHGLVKLKPGNRARVEDFWKVVWGNGNKPKETRIVAVGEVVERSGRRFFRLSGTGQEYALTGIAAEPGKVRLTGVLDPPKDRKAAVPIRVEKVEATMAATASWRSGV